MSTVTSPDARYFTSDVEDGVYYPSSDGKPMAETGIHVTAILFYLLVRRDNLVGPMVTGRKSFDEQVEPPAMASAANFLVGVGLAAAIAWWISRGLKL